MREPYQILSIPYRIVNDTTLFCIFHRTNGDYWQFIAGGGENNEKPIQAALREIQVDPARRVGDNERFHAEERHHAHRHGDILQVITLIIVEAPLHHAHALPVEGARPPASGVTGCGRHGEAGYVLVVDVLCVLEGIDVVAEPRTEDNADFSLSDALADGFGSGLETLHEGGVCHGDDSFR